MNIALVSPSTKVYSETFIDVHKDYLEGNILHYHDGEIPSKLGKFPLILSRRRRILDIVKGHFRLNKFSIAEQALITSFQQKKIDLVFAEYGGTGERILPVCKKLNLPLIVHFHGFDASRADQLEMNSNYRGIFDYANYIICVSRKMEKELLELGCPAEKLIYNVYGPREEFLNVAPHYNSQKFIALGRFVDKKAPYYLILSFLEVLKEFPEARLVIAGDGDLFNTCRNLVSYYRLEDRIELPGIISSEKFRDYLSRSLAFVQHSIKTKEGDSEGTPLAVLEASAAGLPVVSTMHGGIPDVIEEGKSGLLTSEHDVIGFAENMKTLLRNPQKAQQMGSSGKRNITENYGINRHIEQLNKLILKSLR